jgi:hypothetical protein
VTYFFCAKAISGQRFCNNKPKGLFFGIFAPERGNLSQPNIALSPSGGGFFLGDISPFGAEEQRSRGAEEQRSRGAEDRKSPFGKKVDITNFPY